MMMLMSMMMLMLMLMLMSMLTRRSAGHSRSSPGRNPMSKYTMAEITSIFTSVRLLRAAFDTLMENYR